MEPVTDIAALEALYGTPAEAAQVKVARSVQGAYARWINASRFCALATVGPEGTDCSPRGDEGPVVEILDPGTLAMPDWRGNNRMDSLRNIVADGRVSLMFLVPGSDSAVRVNGQAILTRDGELCAKLAKDGKAPRSVIVIRVGEVYFQCARALKRSALWAGNHATAKSLPTAGEFLSEMTKGAFDGERYDAEWPARAAGSLW